MNPTQRTRIEAMLSLLVVGWWESIDNLIIMYDITYVEPNWPYPPCLKWSFCMDMDMNFLQHGISKCCVMLSNPLNQSNPIVIVVMPKVGKIRVKWRKVRVRNKVMVY